MVMRGVRAGLSVGAIALLLVLLGLFEVAQRWGEGSGSSAMLLGGLALIAGYRAGDRHGGFPIDTSGAARPGPAAPSSLRRGVRKTPWLSRVIDGLAAGAVTAGMVGAFVLVSRAAPVEAVFVRAQPEVVQRLGFGLPPGYDVLGMLILGACSGAVGAVLAPVRLGSRAAPLPWERWDRIPSEALAAGLLLVLVLPLLIGPYWNQVLGSVGLYILLGLGLNVVVGFAGLLDLGYVAFYAIGAYTCAILTAPRFGIETTFWLAAPIAMAVAALAGVLLGVPVLRMRGDYLAIVTLGFGEIIALFLNNLRGVTGGAQGVLQIPAP
ncbi:MAG TPA: hypothetical protein VIN09_03770, partial [Chloroflexota bacterium]